MKFSEKLAAPSTQVSPSSSMPYTARADIKTENLMSETSKGRNRHYLSGSTLPTQNITYRLQKTAIPNRYPRNPKPTRTNLVLMIKQDQTISLRKLVFVKNL